MELIRALRATRLFAPSPRRFILAFAASSTAKRSAGRASSRRD
jgi:hypothetical protein